MCAAEFLGKFFSGELSPGVEQRTGQCGKGCCGLAKAGVSPTEE